jgi:uncharacterized protein YgbK (DUF1537 family)
MSKPWRILSDDLTGALDTAAAWAAGNEVPVFLDTPSASAQPVQVVVTGTRDVPVGELPERLNPSLDWFTATGSAFKKIDSLLRGNTFAELALLMRSGRFAGAVFAPAYPGQGRFTAQGRHWVASPHQPYGPRSHEHPGPLAQTLARVGLGAQIPAQVSECLRHPGHVVIPDVLADADLDDLAALTTHPQAGHWLWCGSAGLAWALVRQQTGGATAAQHLPPCGPGRPLVLTASQHPVLREQLHLLAVLNLPIDLVDLAEREPLAPAVAQARLAQRMDALVAHHPRPPLVTVVGGDTLLALCRAAGVRSLQAGSSPRPGWGRARLVGGVWDGLCCYSRSGAFGPPEDLGTMLSSLVPPRTPPKEPAQ